MQILILTNNYLRGYHTSILHMFRTVYPSIIRSLRLYIQHQVYVTQILWLLASMEPQNLCDIT
jgi:hypothetical protein